MAKAVAWGMTMYEQDWLSYTFTQLNSTQANFTAAATWLDALGGAAVLRELGLQDGLVAVEQEPHRARQGGDRARHRGDHHGRPVVTAHGVDGNHQRLGQDGALVLRRVPPDSPRR